ncbi:polysaccharide biosynthesis protein [Paenibacillus validus]|uniref:SDR family NAD(P)-dependent oxidoreductase n=1 Tax=Paenibacillus validus TaxID=44253 RepID=A0A7X3CUT9_9BACL|nr:UDP-N-acetylglucosamine 4,6-dehydratase family protein [Paenibacillus validus]MED4602870.1 polysaccharide biosynthesis protein [Paenibacillus validus]MED4606789.1 polysaccharide biosynthesis protein [Paenibacillus validus]MUG72477.1 SDR family NAD(P)-dependent oxidoreductase [Paenibacillus validus]
MIYHNKKILIIGGTGTIGYHLTRRLLQDNPKVIRIFSRDEFKQYQMNIDFQDQQEKLRFLIGDVRDYQRILRAMEDIDYVFHLAAMKHVPACEYNPFEAVQTNVIGTQNVIQAAMQSGVKKVLFTSSDKAISPTNTYGATKLTAERLISAAEYQKGPKSTVFSSVRFGNVMGSRGSVIPLFKKQILENRCVTVTDLNMVRYMMTPSQAISLLLEANALASGGEVFVLKMPVVKLSDLVTVMIEELCAKNNLPVHDIKINEIGLRPGEKMYEELMTEDESRIALEKAEMYIIPSLFAGKQWGSGNIVSKPMPQENSSIPQNLLRDWLLTEVLI